MSETPIFAALHQGHSNRFALGALSAVVHAPGQIYNPLWLYGPSGVGKTAMLNATAAALAEHPSRPLILRLHTEQFLHDWLRAIKHHAEADFRARIFGFQVIILDHADCLCSRSFTQELLARLLAQAAAQGSQVILASAYSPRELEDMDRTLNKCCQWFLCCSIQLPPPEERVAITRRMALEQSLPLSEKIITRISAAAHSPARIKCIILHLTARKKLLHSDENALAEALDHLLAREVWV